MLSFDWSIPGDTISVSGNSIVINIADLDKTQEYEYKCAARNLIGSSPFVARSLTDLTTESCPLAAMAGGLGGSGLGYLWIVIIILIVVLLALMIFMIVLCVRRKKNGKNGVFKGASMIKPNYIPTDEDDYQLTGSINERDGSNHPMITPPPTHRVVTPSAPSEKNDAELLNESKTSDQSRKSNLSKVTNQSRKSNLSKVTNQSRKSNLSKPSSQSAQLNLSKRSNESRKPSEKSNKSKNSLSDYTPNQTVHV